MGRSFRPWFSPLGTWSSVPAAETQTALRRAFTRWGRPQWLRVDNGTPWGATGGLPTALAMWLIGLGVDLIWNPSRQPQRNGVIERFQGVGQNWGEPWARATAAELQAQIDDADQIQRSEYELIGKLTRMQAFPGLKHSGRQYSRRWESRHWDLGLVLHWLSEHAVPRTVDTNGKVSVYDRGLSLGRRHTGRVVWVSVDPDTVEWLIMDDGGSVLKHIAAQELTRERICGLSVSRERHGT